MVARSAMSEFVFQWPALLALLLLVFPLVWLLGFARKQRLKLIAAMGGGLSTHRRLRDVLRVCAFILLVMALARPGYSPRMESVSRSGRDVVFALDVSQSMLAEDISPSRLEVAKQGVRDALAVLGNERVGLLVYAGSSSILCPLTYDGDFVRYMLEQAHPRTVDFGGTTFQSAVEKAVDQIFMDGREGVQDLVVLTDGGDHGSNIPKVVELLEEKQVDVLLLGLGDPQVGSTIRLKSEDGETVLLEHEGAPVMTKLEDARLREFAAESARAQYVPVGVDPFNLGQLYMDYAIDKQIEASDSESGIVVYKEAAVFFLIPAIVLLLLSECWGARGLQFGQAAVVVFGLCLMPPEGRAATDSFEAEFAAAIQRFEAAEYVEAEGEFSQLYYSSGAQSATPGDLAAVQVNLGLCLLQLADAEAEQSPEMALGYAMRAQQAFLSAKRYAPELQRAGIRLQYTSTVVSDLRLRIAEQEKQDQELNEEMQALIEHLQTLLAGQKALRGEVSAKDVSRKQPRRARDAPPPAPIVMPEDAPQNALVFVEKQKQLHADSLIGKEMMQSIHVKLSVPVPGIPEVNSLMTEPLGLVESVLVQQESASTSLQKWETWPDARSLQTSAEQLIEQILDLISGDSDEQGESSEEWEDYEEDYDYEYSDEDGESTMSSESMEGDFASGAEMQELPVPNYSAEDILMEEQGSLQFRQQKRASANAGKVERDF